MVLNQGGEHGEANVNTPKDTRNAYGKLIQEYSREKLRKQDTRSDYVTKLRAGGAVTAEISNGITFLQDIERFAGQKKEYDGLEITEEKINYHSLVRETSAYFATVSNNKRTLKDLYLQDYDINESTLSSKIDRALDGLSEKQVDDYIKSEKLRKAFLKDQMGNAGLPREKSMSSFLKEFNLEKRYNLLPEDQKVDFAQVVEKIQSGQKIDSVDLETLFDGAVYDQKEKEKLLNKLVPSITLKQARDYNIITEAQADDLKYQQVKLVTDGISDAEVREIAQNVKDEDIDIPTSQFTSHKANRDILIDAPRTFEDFARRYNATVESANKEIQSGNMRKFSTFKENLERFPTVHGVDKLRVGSVLQIKQKVKSQEGGLQDSVLYGEIVSLGDDGYIKFTEKSHENKYDTSGASLSSESYSDFLTYISDGNPNKGVEFQSLNILTPSELDAKIRSGEILEYQGSELKLEGKDQIDADLQSMTRDINETKEALRAKEVQLRNDLSRQTNPKLSSDEIQAKIDADPWVKKYRDDIQERISKQSEKVEKLKNLESRHKERFEDEINELDPEGKEHGLKAGTTFRTKSGHVYTIASISKETQEVIVTSLYGDEPISFGDFYKAFKDQETKRIGVQAINFGELINRVSKFEGQEGWSNFEEKGDTLKKKGVSGSSSYNYLVGKPGKSKELLHIHDITGERVTVSFGEIEEKKKQDKKGNETRGADGKLITDATFKTENKTYIVTTGFLEDYIKENHLEPRSLKEAKDISGEKDKYEKMDKKFHLFSWLYHEKATVADMIKGGTLFYEQLKEMIEMGSDEKANQFALKYLGNFLTQDAKRDMQSRLEVKQKKTMDDYLERLETVASDVALDMIQQWLQDKWGNQFQKEAAVVFMLKKYGVLNAKAMQKHEGKWWWYQALGGVPGDQFFNEIKAEKESKSLPFTEELLVYLLIKKQCSPEGFNGIKRRSKLHKEVKKIRATGKEEEIETGRRDGKDERDIEGRVLGGMDEMKNGNYPNMVGWLEMAIDKGGSMAQMNKIPFCAAFSGVAYSFEEKITDTLKSFPGSNRIMMFLRFFSYHRDLKTLNETILEVCKSLQEKGDPKYASIGTDAQELYNKIPDSTGGLKVRINRAERFYEKYGEIITKVMYGLNTGDNDDNLNKLIFFEKDDTSNTHRAQVFTQYYEALQGYFKASETKLDNLDLMTDSFLNAGTSGMDIRKVSEELLIMRQGHWTKAHGADMWKEVQAEFRAIPQRIYSQDPEENKRKQLELLTYNLRGFISGVMKKMQNSRELAGYNASIGPFTILNKWGVDMTRFSDIQGFDVEELYKGNSAQANKIINEFANNILTAETTSATFYHTIDNEYTREDKSVNTIDASINSTKQKISKNTVSSGDDYFDNLPRPANRNNVSEISDTSDDVDSLLAA